jgi:mono/diheme cytochrome c family protein
MLRSILVAGALAMIACPQSHAAEGGQGQLARGKYLVTIGNCNDCHTPGYFFGKPDMTRYLGGSDVGFQGPAGTVVGRNLTPDKETGLGKWTNAQIAIAIRSGVRPDGRVLAPVMPWPAFSKLTDDDVTAIVLYLKSLPPVRHVVPGPFPADQNPPVFTMKIIPPVLADAAPVP